MSTLPDAFSPPDDARLELTMAAMRSERRNRPRFLLVVASLVLVASLIHLLWTFTGRATAQAGLNRASSSLANVQGYVSQLTALEEKRSSPRFAPDNDMEGKLMRFAEQVGLGRPQITPKNVSSTFKGFRRIAYQGVITEADPALLLRWVTESTDGRNFPGLEVETLKLTPGRVLSSGQVGWTLDITFRRWERQP